MYRIIPLRVLRRTPGVMFDEMVPSDIPKISGIDRVIHGPNSISPGPIDNLKRPWYMHPGQDDNLLVLQCTRYIDIFDPKSLTKASFIVSPDTIKIATICSCVYHFCYDCITSWCKFKNTYPVCNECIFELRRDPEFDKLNNNEDNTTNNLNDTPICKSPYLVLNSSR